MPKIRMGVFIFCVILLAGETAESAEVRYTGKTFRDPFMDVTEIRPVDETSVMQQSIDSMNVQGILYSADNPVAIINGKIYRVGSRLGTGQVVSIEKESVTITQGDKQFTIKQSRGKANETASKSKKS